MNSNLNLTRFNWPVSFSKIKNLANRTPLRRNKFAAADPNVFFLHRHHNTTTAAATTANESRPARYHGQAE
jgi:hypothetical protein